MSRRMLLSLPLSLPLALATLVLVAPHAYAGSWQSFTLSEVDSDKTVAKAYGDFYSSTGDNKVEFRGTMWASEGNCAYIEFYAEQNGSINPFDMDGIWWRKIAENRRVCNTSSTTGRREFDTTRNEVWSGADKVKIRICQEQTGPNDCESKEYWMTP